VSRTKRFESSLDIFSHCVSLIYFIAFFVLSELKNSLYGTLIWPTCPVTVKLCQFLSFQNFDPKKNPAARVYPHGGRKIKEHYWEDVDNPNSASEIACNSIPDLTQTIDKKYLNDFFVESYRSKPSKFPTLILESKWSSKAML
jgi:hypothetical protein